jgi:hypothetical protein
MEGLNQDKILCSIDHETISELESCNLVNPVICWCRKHRQTTSPGTDVAPAMNQQRGLASWTGCANNTAIEEIPTREEVLAGMFFLHDHPIIILFDSRVSHDFMNSICAKKDKLSLVATEAPYVIITPGGRVDADQIVRRVPLKLAERIFNTDLIKLSGQGIDVILGMSLMKGHKVMLDIVAHLVHLNSHMYVKVTLHLLGISCIM